MHPLSDYVLIKLDNTEDTRLILPDSAMRRPNTGTVVSVGPKVHDVEGGDVIIFRESFSVYPVPGDESLAVMHQDNLMLII